MAAVNMVAGVKYGFRMMGYFIGVFILAFIIMMIGVAMVDGATGSYYGQTNLGQMVLGALVTLLGGLTMYAGFIGALYKVIADGVERGNNSAAV